MGNNTSVSIDPLGTTVVVRIHVPDPNDTGVDWDKVEQHIKSVLKQGGVSTEFQLMIISGPKPELEKGVNIGFVTDFWSMWEHGLWPDNGGAMWGFHPQYAAVAPVRDVIGWFLSETLGYEHYFDYRPTKSTTLFGGQVMGQSPTRYSGVLDEESFWEALGDRGSTGAIEATIANVIVHEVFWFGVLGHWGDDHAAEEQSLGYSMTTMGFIQITEDEAQAINRKLMVSE